MPTVFTHGVFRFVIYFNDHRPAHVHVVGQGKEAVFHLHCPLGPAVLKENFGFTRTQMSQIGNQLSAGLSDLCEKWRLIHGGDF